MRPELKFATEPFITKRMAIWRAELTKHGLLSAAFDPAFTLWDSIEAINSCGLTIDRNGTISRLSYTWYPSQSDTRLTRVIYGKAADITDRQSEAKQLAEQLKQTPGLRWDAYITFGLDKQRESDLFLKGYIDLSDVSQALHIDVAKNLSAIIGKQDDQSGGPEALSVSAGTTCNLLGLNLAVGREEAKLYRSNYDGIDPEQAAEAETVTGVRSFAKRLSEFGFRLAYMVHKPSGSVRNVIFYNPVSTPVSDLIDGLTKAGLSQHDEVSKLSACLQESGLESWFIATRPGADAHTDFKLYADYPH